MYSVRWYFQGEEFYRFVPKESPPTFEFPVSGIHVDVSILSILEFLLFMNCNYGAKYLYDTWYISLLVLPVVKKDDADDVPLI